MARSSERHPENVAGEWFVDRRCIGCGASWSVAPAVFAPAADGRFVVVRQPRDAEELRGAEMAAELCPTRSVGTTSRRRWAPHHPVEVAPGVLRLGHNAVDSAGGNSFLVLRAEGNLLVDGPRWSAALARRITELGGIAQIVLTHADDVADAQRYAQAFAAPVTIHVDDAHAAPFADRLLAGRDSVALAAGVTVVPTPGHTEGHVMVLLANGVLLAGDSLGWDPDTDRPHAERLVCWWSWPEQLASIERLLARDVEQIVPGHGAISPRLSSGDMRRLLREMVDRLRAEGT